MNDRALGFDIPAAVDSKLASVDVEAHVLSIFAKFTAAFDEYADRVTAECFSVDDHKKIFAELCKQYREGVAVDAITLIHPLVRSGVDVDYLQHVLTSHDYSSRGIKKLVDDLIALYRSRQLHSVSFKIAELAYSTEPIEDRIDQAQATLQALEVQGGEDEWVDAYTAAIEHSALLEQRASGLVTGLATDLYDFDQVLDGGAVRGNLVIIGARPAMGKTALAMSIGLPMAHKYAVGFVSLEMPHTDVRDRQTAILGRIPMSNIKRPNHGEGLDFSRVVDACERAQPLRWNVTAKNSMNIQQLRSMARKLKRSRGLDVLIVDYIGLMDGIPGKNYGANKAYEIQDVTKGLKSLAKELDIVVFALAQVGRGSDPKKPPTLRDLRDSGSIEQDADVVAFIHRPIQENPDIGEQFNNYATLRIAKNRQGSTGDVHLFYRGEITGFESWSGPPPASSSSSEPKQQQKGFRG